VARRGLEQGAVPDAVVAFCDALDIDPKHAFAILWPGKNDDAPPPEPAPLDRDIELLARRLRDPNVTEAEKVSIRGTIRFLGAGARPHRVAAPARGGRAPELLTTFLPWSFTVPREFDLDWRQVPITLGPDGLYHGKITVGHKANGRLDRRHRTGKTAKEVENKLRELVKEIEAGRKRKPGRTPTVEEWLSTWLTDIAPYGRRALKPRTLADYWSKSRNWIFPHLGAHRLDDLEPEHVDALHAAMRRAKKAESHILKVHAIGRRALAVAMARGKLTRNVFEMVDPPAAAKPKRTPLDTDVARRVIEVAAGRRNGTRWMVGLAIGPRQGEALGLCWPLVDLDAGTVEIAWQLQRLPWRTAATTRTGAAGRGTGSRRAGRPTGGARKGPASGTRGRRAARRRAGGTARSTPRTARAAPAAAWC
jgi:hypothetical protein